MWKVRIKNILSPCLVSALCFQENWQPKRQALSHWKTSQSWKILGHEVSHNKTEDSYQSSPDCISLSKAFWVAGLSTGYTKSWAGALSVASPQCSSTSKYPHEIWLYAVPVRGPPYPLPCRRRRTKVLHLFRFKLPPAHHLCDGAMVLGEH